MSYTVIIKRRGYVMSEKKNWYEDSSAIIFMLIFFFPVGLYLMWKYAKWNQNTKVVISVVFSLYFFGVFLITLSAITLGSTTQTANQPSEVGTPQQVEPSEETKSVEPNSTEKKETSKNSEEKDPFTDAMRKCAVGEGYDIHTTGVGHKSDNVFNDGRKHCQFMFKEVYKGDTEEFINDINIDWDDKKNEEVDGKPLTYYLDILAW